MADRQANRELRRHHTEWWVVCAWASIAVLVAVGLMAASGFGA
ncbi:molybdopterin oxidoreductase [Cellulomonas alba]|uniref:Molybdopterin oxidoreductase n=1 Tax=Cellulomonas alba TaxID=3053467 RepID=A0ABT7SJK2_9CELL|nr:molybdopterin oxidoreductase [Cellulomonas alba]MDM7855734.1 molybdopterin oxidoreductase [Cellulomonas alba]